jgi:hypothetical protein
MTIKNDLKEGYSCQCKHALIDCVSCEHTYNSEPCKVCRGLNFGELYCYHTSHNPLTENKNNNNINQTDPNQITPQSFETNDGKWRLEVEEANFLKITYMEDLEHGEYSKQELTFFDDELDLLIELLQRGKEINANLYKKEEAKELKEE